MPAPILAFGADVGVADISQVIDLGALGDIGVFDLDEIADLGLLGERARPAAAGRKDRSWRPARRARPRDARRRGSPPRRAIETPGPKTTCGSIRTSRPNSRVEGEKHRLRRDQGRAGGHGRAAQPRLGHGLGLARAERGR